MIKTVTHKADLCVVGGGMAGIAAAVAAARGGSSVILMQERPMLGGNASSEIRMWVCGADGENNRETGIIEEISLLNLKYNPEKKYPIWDSLLLSFVEREENITLLLNCTCHDCLCKDGKILSVTGWQMTTQQRHIVEAKYFADCSGDSILGVLSGAEYRFGREAAEEFGEKISTETADSKTMGNSCLIQARYDPDRRSKFLLPYGIRRLTEEEISLRRPKMEDPYENFWYLELGGNKNTVDDAESIRKELISLALGMWDYVKNSGEVDNADNWHLEFLGMLSGKRESRRLIGDCILTQGDVLSGGKFDDVVAYGGWGLDDHHPDGFYHKGNPNTWGRTPSPYGIPYRALYSKNIENLFFAGRNISTTHAALSSTRVMATCSLLGQAVGTAADIAREFSLTPRGVYEEKIGLLQQRLMENGCFLPAMKRSLKKAAAAAVCAEKTKNAELSRLYNGADRNNRTYKEENGVHILRGDTLTYTFSPQYVRCVHVAFDSDLDRKTLSGDRCERYHSMRCNLLPESPTMHLPLTLVSSYRITAKTPEGEEIVLISDNENVRQTVNVYPERELKEISLKLISDYGENEELSLFSFDFD